MTEEGLDPMDPVNWDSSSPGRVELLAAQRAEFKRRTLSARKELEDIRTAYEAGDMRKVEDLLFMHTAMTHDVVKRPEEFRFESEEKC